MILVFYLFLADGFSYVSLSFGAVALTTARILKWKQNMLELKTEQMRNSYLIITLLFIPFVLHNIMPEGFAALSWVGVAVLYYIFQSDFGNQEIQVDGSPYFTYEHFLYLDIRADIGGNLFIR